MFPAASPCSVGLAIPCRGRFATQLREDRRYTLLDAAVTCTDLAPAADVVTLTWSGGRAVLRPSGTEPKLKVYTEVVTHGPREEASQLLARLRGQLEQVLHIG